MRIAHVVATYPPYRGGVGHVVAEYATRLRARGHDVEVFTPKYLAVDGDPPFVHRLSAPVRIGNAAFTPTLVSRLHDFDLIHLHYPFFGGAEPVWLRKRLTPAQPLVLSYHFDPTAAGLKGRLFDAHRRVMLPRILACADRVIVSSNAYASHSALASIAGGLTDIEVHPYGVDLVRFQPGDGSTIRNALGITATDTVLLFVGRLDPAHHFKGLPVLLQALSALRNDSWRAIVVGDGPLRPAFERRAAELGLSARTSFVGDVSDDRLPEYYRAANIHLFPSTAAAEAFGLVCLEAAATGVPTIASDLPGVNSVVVANRTGLLVAPGEARALAAAIARLLHSPDLRQQLGQTARRSAESRFHWDPLIARLEETYRLTMHTQPQRVAKRGGRGGSSSR